MPGKSAPNETTPLWRPGVAATPQAAAATLAAAAASVNRKQQLATAGRAADHNGGAAGSTAEDGTTLGQTSLNMINCFIGAGILMVPFAFKVAGFGAILALALVAALNWLTSLLLGHALTTAATLRPDLPRCSLDLQALGAIAFGPVGQRLIAVLFALELWFALETFILLTSINVNIVTGLPESSLIVGVGLVGTMSLWLPMSVISAFSGLSVWCMLGGLAALIVCGSMTAQPGTEHRSIDVRALPSAMGIFLYCFSGLPCLPNIRAAMQRPEKEYSTAVHSAFAFAIVYYSLVGTLGYYFFAAATSESFTQNLVPIPGMAHEGAFRLCALLSAGMFAMKLQAGFPLYAAPVLQTLGYGVSSTQPLTIATARAAFAMASIWFALFARHALDGVAELMGAFLTMSTSVLFPVAAYAAIRRKAGSPLSWLESLGLGLIFFAGLGLGALGTAIACHHFWSEERIAGNL